MNYEIDDYVEANHKIPARDIVLQTKDSDFYQFKSDALLSTVTYSTDKNVPANLETISAERAHEIIAMNKRGEKPLSLLEDGAVKAEKKSSDLLEDADISRFDRSKRNKKKNKAKSNENKGQSNRQEQEKVQEQDAGQSQGQTNNTQPNNAPKRNRQDNRRHQGQRRQGGKPKHNNAQKENKE